MSSQSLRFAGEYHGACPDCDGHTSFAFGFADDREPRAQTWDGPECVTVAIRDIRLIRQVDDDLWISLEYACRFCGAWSTIKCDCRVVP